MHEERKLALETLRGLERQEERISWSHSFQTITILAVMWLGGAWFVCSGGSTCLAANPKEGNALTTKTDVSLSGGEEKDHVKWMKDYDKAIARARKLKRPVLIDFAASWCVPCVMMKKHVWPEDAVEDALENRVVPLRIDMDGKTAPPLIEKFEVEFVPTILLIDAKGMELQREGFVNAKKLLEMIDAATKPPQPESGD